MSRYGYKGTICWTQALPFKTRQRNEIFICCKTSRPTLGPGHPSTQRVTDLFPREENGQNVKFAFTSSIFSETRVVAPLVSVKRNLCSKLTQFVVEIL